MWVKCALFGKVKSAGFAVTVEPTDTIEHTKGKLLVNMSIAATVNMQHSGNDKVRSDASMWSLMLDGTPLDDGKTLAACGIEDGACVDLVVTTGVNDRGAGVAGDAAAPAPTPTPTAETSPTPSTTAETPAPTAAANADANTEAAAAAKAAKKAAEAKYVDMPLLGMMEEHACYDTSLHTHLHHTSQVASPGC
jgi:hypothetical protein